MMNSEPNGPIDARRVEHMKCLRCGEILPLERDAGNMSSLPMCACGQRAKLGDLLGQMREMVKKAEGDR